MREEKAQGKFHFIPYYLSISSLAAVFNETEKLDSAKKYFEFAIQLAIENKDTLYTAGALNNMGMFLVNYRSWDESKKYFDRALETIQINTDGDSILYCSIRDNIADYYFFKGDTSRGIEIVEENMRFLRPSMHSYEKLIRWGQKLLNHYLTNHQPDPADSLISRLKVVLGFIEGEWKYKNTSKLLEYELDVAKMRKDKHSIQQLTEKQADFFQDYLAFLSERNTTVNQLVSEYKAYSINQELKASENAINEAKRKGRFNIMLFFASLIVSSLIISLIVTNYRRRIKIEHRDIELKAKELEIARLEKDKFQFELENKSKDFSNLLMQSTLREDWSKYLVERLQGIRKQNEEESKKELKDLVIELRQKAGMYEKIHELQKGMEEANTNFFKSIETKFPALTRAEKETCGLIRMNMQAKEIALIRNISPSSVRKLRQRIRSKIGLDPKDDLYAFIKNI